MAAADERPQPADDPIRCPACSSAGAVLLGLAGLAGLASYLDAVRNLRGW